MEAKIDVDAARRQATNKISNSMMTLMWLQESPGLTEEQQEWLKDVQRDLTRARFLLVKHCDPDNILDELSQL